MEVATTKNQGMAAINLFLNDVWAMKACWNTLNLWEAKRVAVTKTNKNPINRGSGYDSLILFITS